MDERRMASREEAQRMGAGAEHFLAYVGPPKQYDFMGATQFRLLTTLGLREEHRVLDVGCGSLRAGRLLIPYLLEGRYCGIEPNGWLVEDGIKHNVGQDLVALKAPRFSENAEFRCDEFGDAFDFIVAQSIFSHATPGLVATALRNFKDALAPTGLVACTFIEADPGDAVDSPEGWIYPECVTYSRTDTLALFRSAGLATRQIPWYHPRQTWWLAALDASSLPSPSDDVHLRGTVLRDPEFAASLDG